MPARMHCNNGNRARELIKNFSTRVKAGESATWPNSLRLDAIHPSAWRTGAQYSAAKVIAVIGLFASKSADAISMTASRPAVDKRLI